MVGCPQQITRTRGVVRDEPLRDALAASPLTTAMERAWLRGAELRAEPPFAAAAAERPRMAEQPRSRGAAPSSCSSLVHAEEVDVEVLSVWRERPSNENTDEPRRAQPRRKAAASMQPGLRVSAKFVQDGRPQRFGGVIIKKLASGWKVRFDDGEERAMAEHSLQPEEHAVNTEGVVLLDPEEEAEDGDQGEEAEGEVVEEEEEEGEGDDAEEGSSMDARDSPSETGQEGHGEQEVEQGAPRRCGGPGCSLPDFHPGLCESQRVVGPRQRRPSARVLAGEVQVALATTTSIAEGVHHTRDTRTPRTFARAQPTPNRARAANTAQRAANTCTEEEDDGSDSEVQRALSVEEGAALCFCGREPDSKETWVQCDGCDRWCHASCAGFQSRESASNTESHRCPDCNNPEVALANARKMAETEGLTLVPSSTNVTGFKGVKEKGGRFVQFVARGTSIGSYGSTAASALAYARYLGPEKSAAAAAAACIAATHAATADATTADAATYDAHAGAATADAITACLTKQQANIDRAASAEASAEHANRSVDAAAAIATNDAAATSGVTQVVEIVDEPNMLPGWSAWLHVPTCGKRYKSYRGPAGERVESLTAMRRYAECEALALRTQFTCKHPGCGMAYNTTDGVRKHCHKLHHWLVHHWLSSLTSRGPETYCSWQDSNEAVYVDDEDDSVTAAADADDADDDFGDHFAEVDRSRLNRAQQRLAECLSAADPRLFDPYDTARIIALERPVSLLECITDFDMLAAFVSEVVAELVDDMKMQAQYARRRPSGSRKEKEKVGAVDAADAVDAV